MGRSLALAVRGERQAVRRGRQGDCDDVEGRHQVPRRAGAPGLGRQALRARRNAPVYDSGSASGRWGRRRRFRRRHMKRHALRIGEYYAIKPNAIERDADGFFILVGDSVPDNEARGTVGVVHVRGALSQFAGEGGDSYEAIVRRVEAALAADPKPTAVVLAISS